MGEGPKGEGLINIPSPLGPSGPLGEGAPKGQMRGCLKVAPADILYARTFERTLLAGDMPIRDVCTGEGIDIRGSLWIVREAFERGVVTVDELLGWLHVWPLKGRWLPKDELKILNKGFKVDNRLDKYYMLLFYSQKIGMVSL